MCDRAVEAGAFGAGGKARASRWRGWLTPHRALVAFAVVHSLTIASGVVRLPSLLGDEVIYVSQFATGIQPAPMNATRSWGMPLLLAPVDTLTASVPVIRAYLSVVAGLGLYIAYRPWLSIAERWVAPVAAALFATLWTSVIMGSLAYPNQVLAYGAVAAVGHTWSYRSRPTERRGWVIVGLIYACMSLIRPTESLLIAAPVVVLLTARRSWTLLASTGIGLSIGWIAWFGEAEARFGGILARFRESSAILKPSLDLVPRHLLTSADGPTLFCRPATVCQDLHRLEVLWLVALPLLVALGIWASRERAAMLVVTASALLVVAQYGFLFDWSNPRFLQPAYALLALPVATLGVRAARWHPIVALVLVAVVAVHTGLQFRTFERVSREVRPAMARRAAQARVLTDDAGVRPPCVVFGPSAIEMSYLLRCRPAVSTTAPAPAAAEVQEATRAGQQGVIILPLGPEPVPVDGWSIVRLLPSQQRWAYVSLPKRRQPQPPAPTGPVGRS